MTKLAPGEETEPCGISGCKEEAAYHLLKIRDDNSEEETWFCAAHGEEYARRAHLGISGNI